MVTNVKGMLSRREQAELYGGAMGVNVVMIGGKTALRIMGGSKI